VGGGSNNNECFVEFEGRENLNEEWMRKEGKESEANGPVGWL